MSYFFILKIKTSVEQASCLFDQDDYLPVSSLNRCSQAYPKEYHCEYVNLFEGREFRCY